MTCISPVYCASVQMHVPCGKCGFCIKKNIQSWCIRLYHEMEYSSAAHFITLTYNDENLPENNALQKRDLQDFFRALRKRNIGIRYFAVGEYGGLKGRPHYHAVVFNVENPDLITRSWTKGFVSGSKATMGRIHYMVAYMALPNTKETRTKPFRIMSRRPGIGAGYLTSKTKRFHRLRSEGVIHVFDTPNAMPRYYKDKIFTNKHEKAKVIQKAMDYSDRHNLTPCPVQHERIIQQLQRKHK